MRLDKVTIGEFKNLRNLQVDFDEKSPYTVLVGENGAGKSNLIEALSLIFRNLDLDVEAPFSYQIRYQCREHDVEIHAERDQFPRFSARSLGAGEYVELPRKRFMTEDEHGRPFYRPGFVFGYYSGPSDRLAVIFETRRVHRWTGRSAEASKACHGCSAPWASHAKRCTKRHQNSPGEQITSSSTARRASPPWRAPRCWRPSAC